MCPNFLTSWKHQGLTSEIRGIMTLLIKSLFFSRTSKPSKKETLWLTMSTTRDKSSLSENGITIQRGPMLLTLCFPKVKKLSWDIPLMVRAIPISLQICFYLFNPNGRLCGTSITAGAMEVACYFGDRERRYIWWNVCFFRVFCTGVTLYREWPSMLEGGAMNQSHDRKSTWSASSSSSSSSSDSLSVFILLTRVSKSSVSSAVEVWWVTGLF